MSDAERGVGGIVHQKYWKFHAFAENWQKCIALYHLLTNESSAGNGAVRLRVQTADKNIIIIHTTSNSPLINGFVFYKHSFSFHQMLTDGLESCGLLD